MKLITGIILLILAAGPCKTKTESKDTPTKKDNTIEKSDTIVETGTIDESINNIRISFYSRGEGIDRTAKSKFHKFIEEYQTTNNLALPLTKIRTGEEGEIDFCVDMKNIPLEKVESFIKEVKALFTETSLVHINRNIGCSDAE